MDLLTILAAFGPLVVDAGRSLIQKYMAPSEFKPTNIDDYLKMRGFDLEMFKAMNDAGGANPSYPWVEAFVRLMRPSVAVIVLSVWGIVHLQIMNSSTGAIITDTSTIDNFAAAIGFYLFGDRTLFYSKQGIKK
jgi:hypothetical protein